MKISRIFSLIAAVAAMSLASCAKLGDLGLEPVPDIAFVYESNGLTLTFKSVTPGTSNVQWEVVGQTTGSGETFTYSFPEPGNYWIKMTGTFDGKEQVSSGKILVAKPSAVKLDDKSFDDWKNVTYPDFQLVSADGFGIGKFDYDANYLYFYMEMDVTQPNASADDLIINIRMDSDDLQGTGMSTKGIGADWYLEANFWSPNSAWSDMYDCATGDTVWDESHSGDKSVVLGTYKEEGGKMYCEFAFSRKEYGVKGSSVGIFWKFYNCNWEDFTTMTCNGLSTYHFALDKKQ